MNFSVVTFNFAVPWVLPTSTTYFSCLLPGITTNLGAANFAKLTDIMVEGGSCEYVKMAAIIAVWI